VCCGAVCYSQLHSGASLEKSCSAYKNDSYCETILLWWVSLLFYAIVARVVWGAFGRCTVMITLQPGENILMEVRKHWLGIVVHAIFLFIIALVLFVGMPFIFSAIRRIFPDIISNTELQAGILFFEIIWLWFVWAMFFVMWTNYYLDVVVITNKRLIDMEQFVLFSRDEVSILLENMEDVKIEVKGFLATIFRFGNLQIQTAGATKETIAKNIMRPEAVHACLVRAIEHQKHPT